MSTVALDPMLLRGFEIPVFLQISDNEARFGASFASRTYSDNTYRGLRSSLMQATKKASAQINVPFTLVSPMGSPGEVKAGVVTGVSAATGGLLVRYDDGTTGEFEGSVLSYRVLAPLTEPERGQLLDLALDCGRAIEALETFRSEHRVNLREEVEAAIREIEAFPQEGGDPG